MINIAVYTKFYKDYAPAGAFLILRHWRDFWPLVVFSPPIL
ncbi:hypothetical protein [Runella rosea]|nr:hypothetical protein [Runella rosea]